MENNLTHSISILKPDKLIGFIEYVYQDSYDYSFSLDKPLCCYMMVINTSLLLKKDKHLLLNNFGGDFKFSLAILKNKEMIRIEKDIEFYKPLNRIEFLNNDVVIISYAEVIRKEKK